MIAHNAKFDYGWLLTNGIDPTHLYCTMIAEQKLSQGSTKSANLIQTSAEYGIIVDEEGDKAIRNDFIGADPDTMVFTDAHILYAMADVKNLLKIKTKQLELIEKRDMMFMIISIQMPLIKAIAEMELTGFVHDSERLRKYLDVLGEEIDEKMKELEDLIKDIDLSGVNLALEKEQEKREISIEKLKARLDKNKDKLDEMVAKGKTHLKTFATIADVFERDKERLKEKLDNPIVYTINWGSPAQVLALLYKLEVSPIPRDKDAKTHQMKDSISKGARTVWLSENEANPHYRLIKTFDTYKKMLHNYNSFGEKWIEKYVQSNGKVYTNYRQASTSTGRFSCGNKNQGFPNLQQIPKITDSEDIPIYRVCFATDEGRSIFTGDYTGCEIVCMISLSGDLELKKISELPDQHSYMGTKCWKNIYQKRYENTGDEKWKELAENYEMNQSTPEGKKMRTRFKESGVFPVIYGVYKTKVAKIQGFTEAEGQIFIDTIEQEMPKVVNFVKSKANEALQTGEVLHNTRTNSIRIFDKVKNHLIYGEKLEFMDKVEAESAARNSPIQGTNADIIAEAIVTIRKWIKVNKLDIRLLGQVHDELIYDMPDEYLDWAPPKLKELMCRSANRYLIPEIKMEADYELGKTWTK